MSDTLHKVEALVIGGGPAGLAAAEALSVGGHQVLLAEQMPSLGRKFLMAGKSGLNLTKDEPIETFLARYMRSGAELEGYLRDFGPEAVQDWAKGLGQEIFIGSTGRVFPDAMKASPLLRAWIARLRAQGVSTRVRWRWTGWDDSAWAFEAPEGKHRVLAKRVVLALGGGSWARLGSNGRWAELLTGATPFEPSNMGFLLDWSPHMLGHFGTPVKACCLQAGAVKSRGEWVISARGIEGGGVYEVSQAVRDGAELKLDLQPDRVVDDLVKRLERKGKGSVSNSLRKAGLTDIQRILLMEWGRPLPKQAAELAKLIKSLPIPIVGPTPLDEAISTAGGMGFGALDGLMLRDRPGVFLAGEMLDWDAPTGGYLLTACLATGFAAGRAAADWG